MAWPLSRYQDFVDNAVPAIASAFLHAVQDAQNHVYRGTQTLKALVVDGTGGAAATPTAGDIVASRSVRVGRAVSGTSAPTPSAALGEIGVGVSAWGWGACDGTGLTRGVRVDSFVRNAAGDYTITFSAGLGDPTNVAPWVKIIDGTGAVNAVYQPIIDLSVSGGTKPVLRVRTGALVIVASLIKITSFADAPFAFGLYGE